MTSRIVIGIDPGVNGAIAILTDSEAFTFYDMPTRENSLGLREVDPYGVSQCIREICHSFQGAHIHAVLEQISVRMTNAQSVSQKIGRYAGMIEGVLASYDIKVTRVTPQAWKSYFRLLKTDKNMSRTIATEMFPAFGSHFRRVKDHDRAEALLMAVWGNDTECWLHSTPITYQTDDLSTLSH